MTTIALLEDMTLAVATYTPAIGSYEATGYVYIFSATTLGMASGYDVLLQTEAEVLSILRLPMGATLLGGTIFHQNRPSSGIIEVFSPEEFQKGGRTRHAIRTSPSIARLALVDADILAASASLQGTILFYEIAQIVSRGSDESVGPTPAKPATPIAQLDLDFAIQEFAARW